VIHRPFSRIHAVMYLLTAVVVLATSFEIVIYLTHSNDAGLGLVLGVSVLVVLNASCGAVVWVAYLAYQLSVELNDGRLLVRSWLKIGRLGTERRIDLAQARRALILRPNFVEFDIPGATTRVWSGYHLLRDRDRLGTMWWFD
jgi:hypothetical protein